MALLINEIQSSNRTNSRKVTLSEKYKSILTKDITVFSKKLSLKKKAAFYNNIHLLLSAGVTLKYSLEILSEQESNSNEKDLTNELLEKIIMGENFSDALFSTGKITYYEYYSLKIGEETGRQKEAFQQLSGYFSEKLMLRNKIMNSLSYPVLILSTSVLVVIFMIKGIVPMFSEVYSRMDQELPDITLRMINLSENINRHLLMLIIITGCIFIFHSLFRKNILYKGLLAKAILAMPVTGKIIYYTLTIRFCKSMSLMLSSSIPLLKALEMQKKIIMFYPFSVAFSQIEKDILIGNSLHKSISKHKIFDGKLVKFVKIGEDVNKLDEIFTTLGNQYTIALNQRIALLNSLLEPIIIIFVGIIVAIILIAMYLPIFQISTSIY